MATRLLLTLLALLTGLAAQITPAQARIRAEGATAVGSIAAVARSERAVVARLGVPARPVTRHALQRRCTVMFAIKEAECTPPVMLGIDRARE